MLETTPCSKTKMITNKDIINSGPIGEWDCYEDSMSGTLEWFNKKLPTIIYATPHWETDGVVPIDLSDDGGNYESILSHTIDSSLSIDEQLRIYRTLIASVIETLTT